MTHMTHMTHAPIDPDDAQDADRTPDAEAADAWDAPLCGHTWQEGGETWPLEDHVAAPWFLPPTSSLLEEEEIDDLEWVRQAAAIPFVQRCRLLRDFVGDGRPLTDSGVLPNAAVRELKQRAGIVRPGGRLREVPELLGPWVVLLNLGVLVEDGSRRVRRCSAEHPGVRGAFDEDDEPLGELDGEVDGVLAIAELLHVISRYCPGHGGFRNTGLLLESLLAATREDGVTLPELPGDGCLDEPAIARLFRGIGANTAITWDPIDERRGEVDLQAIADLADAQRDLFLLEAYGILGACEPGRSGIVFRAPRPVRTAVALLALRRQQEEDARRESPETFLR
ncbi:hypothetical protein [Brachybacterium sp. NPDC056505]|uniref:hypothetical protein n=1 Tax=Brachybacterium sp. NPDC056505 TaxID=3345843 RepID=UPI00366D5839